MAEIEPGVFECGCLYDGTYLVSDGCTRKHDLPRGTVIFRHGVSTAMPTEWPEPPYRWIGGS